MSADKINYDEHEYAQRFLKQKHLIAVILLLYVEQNRQYNSFLYSTLLFHTIFKLLVLCILYYINLPTPLPADTSNIYFLILCSVYMSVMPH